MFIIKKQLPSLHVLPVVNIHFVFHEHCSQCFPKAFEWMVVVFPFSAPSVSGLPLVVLLCSYCFYLQFSSEGKNGAHSTFFSSATFMIVSAICSPYIFCKYTMRTYVCYFLTLLCQHLSEMSVRMLCLMTV